MQALVIIIFAAFVVWALNREFKRTNYYKNLFIDTNKFSDHMPDNLEIVNLGSNQAKFALDYAHSGLRGMNWAVGPQSLDYDFRVLRQFHNHLSEGAFVLIPICPFSFFLHTFKGDKYNYKYYKFLDASLISNYSRGKKLLHIDMPILTAGKNIVRLIKDAPLDVRLEISDNSMNSDGLAADARLWMDGWEKQFLFDMREMDKLSAENKESIEKNIVILNEMIQFCLEKKYRPVCVMLPVTPELRGLLPRPFMDAYVLGPIRKANGENALVLDYLNDERFASPELYFNSFFLNRNGREKFTDAIVNDVRKTRHYD